MVRPISTSTTACTLLGSVLLLLTVLGADATPALNKTALKEQALEMFRHAYWSYMDHAYPDDELMPLSCRGRRRGVTPNRGDVDDALGNFSLTLVDSLDTLVVLGEFAEFERAVHLVVTNIHFDSDLVVSVFETNIRMVGGLISGHLMAKLVANKQPDRLLWYDRQLLDMAVILADKLLPAFNTTTGLPFPRINLLRGLSDDLASQKDTCTACGGTMILEMAALSRLTGNPVYETKAHKAMNFLWQQRHRSSNLMGTVLNVHNGDWVLRDSGVGAGIDSYYEYCLKAYILLGDELYLDRFNKHYASIMRYVNRGFLFVDVHMHRPTVIARPFMDALLAFWPGLQVLKGDLKPAIELHELLYRVVQRHRFLLPEAFTHDLQVHWAQHSLRPEFIESTYMLYRATKDEHYLHVASQVMDSLDRHIRVKCGFAAVVDVRTMVHEDRMDSFVLAETFKYLYLIFAEPDDLIFDPDNFVLTTEAHFLPLSIGTSFHVQMPVNHLSVNPDDVADQAGHQDPFRSGCPNAQFQYEGRMSAYVSMIRNKVNTVLEKLVGHVNKQQPMQQCANRPVDENRLKASDFSISSPEHVANLQRMGIRVTVEASGQVRLTHSTSDISAKAVLADPLRACQQLTNAEQLAGRIAIVERSDCLFTDKARLAQEADAVGLVVIGEYF